MKKNLILLFIILLTKITANSSNISTQIVQDSIPVSTNDIKYTNLIFVEHEELMIENKLLHHQIEHYEALTDNLDHTIILQKQEIDCYKDLNNVYLDEINSLKKEIKKKNRTILCWTVGGITVTAGLLLLLIFK